MSDMNANKTGSLIKTRREELGLTQQDLADRLFVSKQTVSKWERAKGFPDISLLESLAETLEVSVSSLLRGEIVEEPLTDVTLKQAVESFYRQMRRVSRQQVADTIVKLLLLTFTCGFIWFILEFNGVFLKEVKMDVPVGVYVDGVKVEETMFHFDGERSDTTYQGGLVIDYIPFLTQVPMNCSISWDDEYGWQDIMFYGQGSFYAPDRMGLQRLMYINRDMTCFGLKMLDGTILATHESLVPLLELDTYYNLAEPYMISHFDRETGVTDTIQP